MNISSKIAIIPLAPLGANCVIISNNSKQAIIVDPGGEPEKVMSHLDEYGLMPQFIFLTHGHFDHVGAVKPLADRFKLPVYAHPFDKAVLDQAEKSAAYYGLDDVENPQATDSLEDGQTIIFGGMDIRVLHTPGHSAGCVCFYIPELNVVITGDTLFHEGIGRTDLPGGSSKAIEHSIQTKLYKLPVETIVIPGHGETSTIGHEAAHNPYVRRKS